MDSRLEDFRKQYSAQDPFKILGQAIIGLRIYGPTLRALNISIANWRDNIFRRLFLNESSSGLNIDSKP